MRSTQSPPACDMGSGAALLMRSFAGLCPARCVQLLILGAVSITASGGEHAQLLSHAVSCRFSSFGC